MTALAERSVETGAPTGREEAWRLNPHNPHPEHHQSVSSPRDLPSRFDIAPEVTLETVPTESLPVPTSPLEWPASLARAATRRSALLTVPAGATASRPSVITVDGDGIEGHSLGHLVVRAEADSRAVVVVEHLGSATFSGNIEVHVGDRAHLTLVSVQQWNDDTVHLGRQHAVLGRDARFESLVATLGGGVVRITPTVEYTAPGGDAEMLGVFFAESDQHIEHRLLVEHTVPHCRSNVVYKGALRGESAHTVWIGDVIIRAGATGTETYEINRNLLLSTGARADSVPNLEIETGEVSGAGHASATGRFDDEQLFYLQARGIDPVTARRLVVRGFFADVLGRVDSGDWAERIMATVDDKLGGAPAESDEGEI